MCVCCYGCGIVSVGQAVSCTLHLPAADTVDNVDDNAIQTLFPLSLSMTRVFSIVLLLHVFIPASAICRERVRAMQGMQEQKYLHDAISKIRLNGITQNEKYIERLEQKKNKIEKAKKKMASLPQHHFVILYK